VGSEGRLKQPSPLYVPHVVSTIAALWPSVGSSQLTLPKKGKECTGVTRFCWLTPTGS
jgi:hypothetical protein